MFFSQEGILILSGREFCVDLRTIRNIDSGQRYFNILHTALISRLIHSSDTPFFSLGSSLFRLATDRSLLSTYVHFMFDIVMLPWLINVRIC